MQRVDKNADFETVPEGTRRALISNPVPNPYHRSEYGEQFEGARLCGPCHDLFSDLLDAEVPARVPTVEMETLSESIHAP